MNIINCLSSKQILWYQNRYLLPYSAYNISAAATVFDVEFSKRVREWRKQKKIVLAALESHRRPV